MNNSAFSYSVAYNRPQESIAPLTTIPNVDASAIDYSQWGYIPGIAQAAQNIPPNNFVQGKSYFSQSQLAAAHWFTTRVHLTPLGNPGP